MIQMRHFTAVLAVAWLLALLAATALSAERVALVIGNAAYAHAPRLANPLNDAQDVSAALGRLGFAVTTLENADYAALRQGLLAFAGAASAADVAVVFYAGHGIEVDQRNFLVPVDARLARDQDVELETVPLGVVMRAVESASGFRLVILDACRENPFAASMQRAGGTRKIGRGLARVDPVGQTLVAYAARENTVALDGEGRNSPYSAALLAHLEEPDLEILLMFRKVRDAVLASTGGQQQPFVYGSLSSKGVYLAARSEPVPSPSSTQEAGPGEPVSERLKAEQMAAQRLAAERELLFWESVKDSTNPADIQAYLDRYPDGAYQVLARNRLGPKPPDTAAAQEAPPPPPQATPQSEEGALPLGRADHRLIQLGLAAQGFDPGPPDGLLGNQTREALRQWQASRGEAATGYLDVESAKVLLAAGEARDEARREAEAEAESGRRELEPGRRFRDCPECPEMVVVPAGSYMMGSPASEEGRDEDEGPVHRVTILEPLAVGVYEVTRGEFARFVRETGHATGSSCWVWDAEKRIDADEQGFNWRNPGFAQTDRHPVVCVSWGGARAYVRWLSGKTGEGYRLLSESEWEYVARGGTGTARYWGDSELGQCRHANGADVSTDLDWRTNCNDNHVRTSPVGTYTSNGFGLYDVLGNVLELGQDCWNGSYEGAPVDGGAWEGGDCSRRLARGGSWLDAPWVLRSANRLRDLSGKRYNYVGFRVARTLTP